MKNVAELSTRQVLLFRCRRLGHSRTKNNVAETLSTREQRQSVGISNPARASGKIVASLGVVAWNGEQPWATRYTVWNNGARRRE